MAVSKYMSVSVACYTDDSREKTEVAKARSAKEPRGSAGGRLSPVSVT